MPTDRADRERMILLKPGCLRIVGAVWKKGSAAGVQERGRLFLDREAEANPPIDQLSTVEY